MNLNIYDYQVQIQIILMLISFDLICCLINFPASVLEHWLL